MLPQPSRWHCGCHHKFIQKSWKLLGRRGSKIGEKLEKTKTGRISSQGVASQDPNKDHFVLPSVRQQRRWWKSSSFNSKSISWRSSDNFEDIHCLVFGLNFFANGKVHVYKCVSFCYQTSKLIMKCTRVNLKYVVLRCILWYTALDKKSAGDRYV